MTSDNFYSNLTYFTCFKISTSHLCVCTAQLYPVIPDSIGRSSPDIRYPLPIVILMSAETSCTLPADAAAAAVHIVDADFGKEYQSTSRSFQLLTPELLEDCCDDDDLKHQYDIRAADVQSMVTTLLSTPDDHAENSGIQEEEEEEEDCSCSLKLIAEEKFIESTAQDDEVRADMSNVDIDAAKEKEKKKKNPSLVLVTGAGGFIASWIVKLLLDRGYRVRGTLRDIESEVKTGHLRKMEGAEERLELVKADVMDLASLQAAVKDCQGVFHTACPVPPVITDPETQMINPAVEGTLNVLKACSEADVKRVVLTSSIGAVYIDPSRPATQIIDESCWSNETHLREIKEWYCLAKVMAERAAWEYSKTHNLDLVSICPAVTMGTMLQQTVNQSSTHILKFLNGSATTYTNLCQAYTDVKDCAEAHVLAYETPTASGRYLCAKWSLHRSQLVEALRHLYPNYPVPTRCKDESRPRKLPLEFSSKKVEDLGLKITSLEGTLVDAVTSLEDRNCIAKTIGQVPITPKFLPVVIPRMDTFDVPSAKQMVREASASARHHHHHRRTTSSHVDPGGLFENGVPSSRIVAQTAAIASTFTLHRTSTATF